MGPLSGKEDVFPEDSPIIVVLDTLKNQFKADSSSKRSESSVAAQTLVVDVYWGVKELDKSTADKWDAEVFGTAIMDRNFELSSVSSQTNLLTFCSELRL